jgi:hypothetical protein
MKRVKLFEQFILESGNAISDSRPFEQEEIPGTIEWIEKNVFPTLGINGVGDDAAILGSAGKKLPGVTSGDIDMALSADKIAGNLGASLSDVIFKLNEALESLGLDTAMNVGLKQISIGAPIDGDYKNGTGQVDFMLSRDLKWSTFMYHSPDFTKDESKYKGAYRNILLMSIIGKSFYEITKQTEGGETAEYEAYVIRLNKGVFKVRKSFEGKKGLIKNAKLLKEFDKEITNAPDDITDILFDSDVKAKDIMTYENLKALLESASFKFTDKVSDILDEFKKKLVQNKLPLPEDLS